MNRGELDAVCERLDEPEPDNRVVRIAMPRGMEAAALVAAAASMGASQGAWSAPPPVIASRPMPRASIHRGNPHSPPERKQGAREIARRLRQMGRPEDLTTKERP
jgi:hypothetical protein